MTKQKKAATKKGASRKPQQGVTATPPVDVKSDANKSRYSDAELAEFDQLIDARVVEVKEQILFYESRLRDISEDDSNKVKNLEEGVVAAEREDATRHLARQQKFLQHLINAKHRIKNKVYGICRETGKLIPKERLIAVPHATMSVEAKFSRDQEEAQQYNRPRVFA